MAKENSKKHRDPGGQYRPEQPVKLTVHAAGQTFDAAIDARRQLGPKLINFGAEQQKNRLDYAETLIHLLIRALKMRDPNLQRVTHGMILTQPPAPRGVGCVTPLHD